MKKSTCSIAAIILTLCIFSFLTACSGNNAELEAEILRVEKMAQRALDVQEVQNVWSRHAS